MNSIVIIGAGQAGCSAAVKLRKDGFTGRIHILGEESHYPYQRPPLSKKFLKEDILESDLHLKSGDFYKSNQIEIETNALACEVNRESKIVKIKDGRTIEYDKLIFATGSSPRLLPENVANDFQNICYLRSLDDAKKLKCLLKESSNLLIIGGGYIGLEMAAVARQAGLNVTLVEMSERILQRVASSDTSDYFRKLHKDQGVEIFEGVGLTSLTGSQQKAKQAVLSNGKIINIDLVVAGIGVIPNDALAAEAGLQVDNGIIVNNECTTIDKDIYAVGDCSVYPFQGTMMRIESVPNAIIQGEIAADSILGFPAKGYKALPWFWSDQYDCKLQIAGINNGYDKTLVRPGESNKSLSIWYYKKGSLISVDAINDAKAFMGAKKLISLGLTPDDDKVKDINISINEIIKS